MSFNHCKRSTILVIIVQNGFGPGMIWTCINDPVDFAALAWMIERLDFPSVILHLEYLPYLAQSGFLKA
jgi:hypothetical protein